MPILHAGDMLPGLMKIKREGRARRGLSTGFPSLDELMLLNKQKLMIVTGIAGKGKSEFVDALVVNTAYQHGWKWMYFSPESQPYEQHLQRLVEKRLGQRLISCTDTEIREATEWLHAHVTWLCAEDTRFSLEHVMQDFESFMCDGNHLDGIIYDPWNELDHSAQTKRDDQYIADCLTKVRRFHRKYDLLTVIVIHPHSIAKDKNGNYPVVTLQDCNGGAMWGNKADYGICFHRPDPLQHGAEVIVQKVKTKEMGHVGKVFLPYDVPSGRFKDENAPSFELPPRKEELPFPT